MARHGLMVKVGQAALNLKEMRWGRKKLLEQGVPELGACGLWWELSDYYGEVREDRVTPKGHRKTVHERGGEKRWGRVEAKMRLQAMG